MSRALLCVLALALSASAALAQTTSSQPPPSIVTQGEAILKRAPDRAWLTVATETRDSRAAGARAANAELMTTVQSALRRAGVAANAIRTTGFSLTPDVEWNNGRSVQRGYIVRNQIEVRVDELDKLGDVIDAANVPKNTGLTIIGPRFGLKDEAAVENEALRMAVQAAMTRAESIAAGARKSLGPIVRIEEQNMGGGMPQPMVLRQTMSKAADAVETPITPGEIEVRAVVLLTVEIR